MSVPPTAVAQQQPMPPQMQYFNPQQPQPAHTWGQQPQYSAAAGGGMQEQAPSPQPQLSPYHHAQAGAQPPQHAPQPAWPQVPAVPLPQPQPQQAPLPQPPTVAGWGQFPSASAAAAPLTNGSRVRVRNSDHEPWLTGVLRAPPTGSGQPCWATVDGKEGTNVFKQVEAEQAGGAPAFANGGAAAGAYGAAAAAPPPAPAAAAAAYTGWPQPPPLPMQPMPQAPAPPAPTAVTDDSPEFPSLVVDFMNYISGRYGGLLASHDAYCDQLKQRQTELAARRAKLEERERALLDLIREERRSCDAEQAELDRMLQEQADVRKDCERDRGTLTEDFRDIAALQRRLRTSGGEAR